MTTSRNYRDAVSNHGGVITSRTRNGSYNIVEKDLGDRKVIYHIPIEYGDNYDISQLEDIPMPKEESSRHSPKLVRRRIIHEYQDFDDDDDVDEYVEEVPVLTPRRQVYYSPRRSRDKQVIEEIYERRSPEQRIEYVYEDDSSDVYEYKPNHHEEVEYIAQERVPKATYVEEPRPARRIVYVDEPSIPLPSSRLPPPSPPSPPPVSYTPRRSPPYQPSPRPIVNRRSPSPIPMRSARRNNFSPRPPLSTRKQQPARSPIYEPPVKPNIPKTTEPPLRLMDIIAQNRAKRGSRIPKPRREVEEEKVYDPPTYKRNLIKNGFIVHK